MLLKAVVFLVLFGLIGVERAWGQEIGTSSRLELCLNGNWLRSAGGDGSVLPDEGWQNDLRNSVFLGQGKALDIPDETISVAAGESHTAMVFANWADPQMWGYPPYGEPVLYHLETRLLMDEGAEIDQLVARFGFREFWTEEDKIIFNGKPLRILGYWVPEGSGRSIWTLRMAAIQWAGCNAIHNHAEQRESTYYDVADELGLLVWDADFCGGPPVH